MVAMTCGEGDGTDERGRDERRLADSDGWVPGVERCIVSISGTEAGMLAGVQPASG